MPVFRMGYLRNTYTHVGRRTSYMGEYESDL